MTIAAILTCSKIAQLSASHIGISSWPEVITDSPPHTVQTDLHTTSVWCCPTYQPNVASTASCERENNKALEYSADKTTPGLQDHPTKPLIVCCTWHVSQKCLQITKSWISIVNFINHVNNTIGCEGDSKVCKIMDQYDLHRQVAFEAYDLGLLECL